MPAKRSRHVEKPRKYEALKRKGLPKARAAKIANAPRSSSRKGGKRSHKKR